MNSFRNGMNPFQNGMNMIQTGMKIFQIGTGIWGNQTYQTIKKNSGSKKLKECSQNSKALKTYIKPNQI